jgi:tetratricopeptide (TPR) repeat protein
MRMLAIAGAAAAVALAFVILRQPAADQPEVRPNTPPATHSPPAPSRNELIGQIALFDPPPYLQPNPGGGDHPNFLFTTAMGHYDARDFDEAARSLRVVVGSAPSAEALFYLGIACLEAGQRAEGIARLQQAIDLGDPIYEEDARFFLSKARLQSRDVEAARAELERVVALKANRAREAGDIIAAIDALPPA